MLRTFRRGVRGHVALLTAALLTTGVATIAGGTNAVAGAAPMTLAQPPDALGTGDGTGSARTSHSVTLITGDRVTVAEFSDGRQAATIEPGEGRTTMNFEQIEVDGDLYVIPLDAMPYLSSEQLDRDLFNITELIEQRYDDERSTTLPLIVTYHDGVDPAGPAAALADPPGAGGGPTLESINGRAVAPDKSAAAGFWGAVTGGTAITHQGMEPNLAAGIDRIWLDGRVSASLDESVPQVGAPGAWQSGYDGRGVTVAVLDTGVDANHPDLLGKVTASQNFTDSPDEKDKFGHGTHVASIIAGSGAASGGARKGVAPAADLISGKVLNDDGYGQESWIIDGMEWAAGSNAGIINMSLGGEPTDGTDAMSQALDALTARTGKLFVVSAGNSGEFGEFTVGSPGAASAALTVGAVDREDRLAAFSSRGPRLGDFAVKPDITAPGVGIVAARAKGTSMGTPWDANYTAASGTSMAAPHVAGAAAIVAQRFPEFTADGLKDALASTAARSTDLSVYAQGGGRLDVGRAVTQAVFATGTLDLGIYPETGKGGEISRNVSYVNTTDATVTLGLSLALRSPGGAPPEDAVRLGQSSVTVGPGATVSVPVVINPARLPHGRYGGYLVATTGSDVVTHTSLSLMKEPPRHRITLTGVGSDGRPAFVSPLLVFGEDHRFDTIGYIAPGGSRTIELGEGTYYLQAVISEGHAPDETHKVVVDPILEVNGDRDVVLDARDANRVVIKTAKPAQQDGIWSFYSSRAFDNRRISHYFMTFDTARHLYVTPTRAVTDGDFEFGSRWSLVAPILTASVLGPRGFAPELFYLSQSPAVDGRRQLTVVDIGTGEPADYARHDVRGKAVLVAATDWDYERLVRDAAAAGAAMAIVIVLPEGNPWSKWNPLGDRLPTMGTLVSQREGSRLRDLLVAGDATLVLEGTPASPYLYDVFQIARRQVPHQIVYEISDENSATVVTNYHDAGGESWSREQRFGWRPWQQTAVNQYQRLVHTGETRTEIVTAGDTVWQHRVKHHPGGELWNPLTGGMTQEPQHYVPGQRVVESWFAPVVRPAVPAGVTGIASYRQGDTLRIHIPAWVDNGRGHYGFPEGSFGIEPDQGRTRLYEEGVLVSDGEWPWGDFPATTEHSTYRLEVSQRRDSPEWAFSTQTDTTWTFASGRPEGRSEAPLPLLQLDYDVRTDLANRAPADRRVSIGFSARHQAGIDDRPVAGMAAWVSYDDGTTWQELSLQPRGNGRYVAAVDHPGLADTNGYATLRVRAWDTAGSTVDQTVLRAYGLADARH